MTRTTMAFDPILLREIKLRAARKGTTLQTEVNALLRQALRANSRPKFRLKIEPFDVSLQPGVDLFDRDSLYRAMEGK